MASPTVGDVHVPTAIGNKGGKKPPATGKPPAKKK
jgi:hypothetical protein